MNPRSPSSDKNILTGFFIMSMMMLVFELLVSRVMSAIAFYHFAFMAISLALFGITVGAVIVHAFKTRLLEQLPSALYTSALLCSYTLIVNLICMSRLKAFYRAKDLSILPIEQNFIIILITIAVPLVACGVCLSLIFEQYAYKANKIYFINLIAASFGCLLFIPLLNFLGVTNAYIILIFGGIFAANLFIRPETINRTKFIALFLLLLACLAINQNSNVIDFKWIKGTPNNRYFYKKWNSYSYVRLTNDGNFLVNPTGWGFAPAKQKELSETFVEQIYLTIDGGAGTVMTRFNGRDLNSINYLRYDLTSLPYHLVSNGDVLVIGIGAGRDILTGLLFNQRSITGVEINKTIIDIHRHLLAQFNGDLSRHPKVRFINNEARSFINSSDKKFDIIQISLIDTFAATQAGAYALSENNLYTTEAIKTYWDHLNDGGMISISYLNMPYMLKIIGASTQALTASGIANPRDHFILIHNDQPVRSVGVANLLVKKTPFTPEEIAVVAQYCKDMGFHFALSPRHWTLRDLHDVSDHKILGGYIRQMNMNIAPATDDNPFFFVTTRLNILQALREFKLFEINNPEEILVSLLVLMTVLTVTFVLIPLAFLAGGTLAGVPVASFSAYFTAIGLAFMFVEMTQITRLSSFLGHPTYSLAVALFTFLFGSGLGSLLLGRVSDRQAMRLYIYLFLTLCMMSAAFTAPLLHHCSKFQIFPRMLIAVAALFPLAFFMGTFLPQGMKLLHRQKAPVALFWGLNGAASVLGSILAMIMQIKSGLSATFNTGIGFYILAALLLFYLEGQCKAGTGSDPN